MGHLERGSALLLDGMAQVATAAAGQLFVEGRTAGTQETLRGCDQGVTVEGRVTGLAVGPGGTCFVSDATSGTIRRTHPAAARAVAVAGADEVAEAGGRRILGPAGLAVGPDGTLFVADRTGHCVWSIDPTGERRIVAGSGCGYRDGGSDQALFRYPTDVALGPDGTCYIADSGNHRIRTISPDGLVATHAGSSYDYGDGQGRAARFRQPLGVAIAADGSCYVADTGNNAIRRVAPDGAVTTLAGSPPGGDADGIGAEVALRWPTSLASGRHGELWVVDYGNGALRLIEHDGASETLFRLTGRRRPLAVALAPGGGVLVAIEVPGDAGRPRTCLIAVLAAEHER